MQPTARLPVLAVVGGQVRVKPAVIGQIRL